MQKLLLVLLLIFSSVANAATEARVILVVGDSLSAAYGIDTHHGWVALLQKRLQLNQYPYRIVNASISGDTTYGGRKRLPQALMRHKPAIVIIELGGNDGLQGISLPQMRENLSAMINTSREQNAKVLLVGVRLPTNYGEKYIEKFHNVYRELARTHRINFVPYLLKDIAERDQLMQADGIHPRREAQQKMLENVWPQLQAIL